LLPRTPDQAFAGYVALARPALDRLTGRVRPPPLTLPLSAKISSRVGVADIVLLAERDGCFAPLAVGDLPLHCLVAATHIAIVDAGSEGQAQGDACVADPLDD
jgi:hypothetical protein